MSSPPEWVSAATSNVIAKVVRGGVADLRPMPRTLIDKGPTRSVYRFTAHGRDLRGEPVLLVPPLAAPAICFDLRRGCSLAEHLLVLLTDTKSRATIISKIDHVFFIIFIKLFDVDFR